MYVERLPPHDERAEESVLGSLLIDGESILHLLRILQPDDFYQEKNRWCYEACLSLWEDNEAINSVTVGHRLASMNRLEEVGGPTYLGHLLATVPTSAHVEHYARIVSRTHTLRRLISAAGQIAALGYEGGTDVDQALGQAEELLFRIRSGESVKDFTPIRDILDKYLEESASIQGTPDKGVSPVPTGFTGIDRLLGGCQRSDLIILASRPSLGKSTLAVNIARYAAGQGSVVGIFSLEMSKEQIGLRLLSSEASVDNHRLRLGLHSDAEELRIINSVGALSELPIYVDDSPLAGLVDIRSKAQRLHMETQMDLLIVDYLQLIQGNSRSGNRVQEISEISRTLKAIARDLNVPLIAVSQLSRAVEQRPSHRPVLSDLRDSGSIEQDADVVMFIHREDFYYDEEQWDARSPGRPYPKDLAEIIVAKHRNGPLDTVNLRFRGPLARFEDMPTSGET